MTNTATKCPKPARALLRDVSRCLRKLPTEHHIDPKVGCVTQYATTSLEVVLVVCIGTNGAIIIAVRDDDDDGDKLYYKARATNSPFYRNCASIYEAVRYILQAAYKVDIGDEWEQPAASIVDAPKATLRRLVQHNIVSVGRLRWIACTVAGQKTKQINKWCDAKLATLRGL